MTRSLSIPILILALSGCAGGAVNQGRDLEWGDDSATDDTSPTTDDSTASDDSAEGDSDTDSDSDSDTDVNWAGDCGNYWDPIDLEGWTKNYDVTYNGSPGNEVQSHSPDGFGGRYRFNTTLTTQAGTGWDGYVDVGCGYGGDEGLFIIDWNVEYTSSGLGGLVETSHSDPRKYLPDESVVGSVGSWDYAYTMETSARLGGDTATPQSIPINVTGTYVERGNQDVTLNGQTFTGYKLVNTYVMVSEGLFAFRREGTIEQVWVKGVGLVTENHEARLDDGTTSSITKSLTSWTALEPIP